MTVALNGQNGCGARNTLGLVERSVLFTDEAD